MLSEDYKDHILNSIGEAVIAVDKGFRINYFNHAAEKLTGFDKGDVQGKICKKILDSDLCTTQCPIALALEAGRNIYDFECSILTKHSSPVPGRVNASVLRDNSGEPIGGIISFRELSHLEEIKRELDSQSQFYGIVGHSSKMRGIFDLIKDISSSDAAVLIQGESGTGKEMIADAIHRTSERADKPFIKVNCSVFPDNLLGSELFGHVKGAFTDAIKDRCGRFELADGGTIFLDEIGEIPQQMQLQLLRILQEGTFERLGESETKSVDVRVIAASNINIKKAISQGKFRSDLFYRLNVIPIELPPLSERKEDIPLLADYFLKKSLLLYRKHDIEFSDEVMEIFINYNWPGNIREMENLIEFFVVRTPSVKRIEKEQLPDEFRSSFVLEKQKDKKSRSASPGTERAALIELLEMHKWNKSRVARELGIGRTTLWRKMKQLGIEE